MPDSIKSRLQTFDPKQQFAVIERRLPHWSQAGTLCFITWRTWDSIPESVLQTWIAERDNWLRQHGITPGSPEWRSCVQQLPDDLVSEFQRLVSDRWNDHLDACHGACVLRQPELATIVADSLRHFDGERYDLTDYVVMPNHIHLLAAFPDEESMLAQCQSWKHFTATRINRVLGCKRRFWQQDGFDHLVRSLDQFDYLRKYIAANPTRARLPDGEYIHESKPM
ncbi:MAG: hypothetical protein EXS05_20515 [Planctomycetaceae bacterium]|nr:hypothetical protein [Planctomycetaceae bacterium]